MIRPRKAFFVLSFLRRRIVAREGFFKSAGVKLHYLDWGGAGPLLLLLAGLGGTAQWYHGLALRLTSDYRVLALTRRGHGRSDKPDAGYDLSTFVKDIGCFLDVMQVEKAVLAGHSFAGIEMPHFARRHPERVAGLIFLDALFPYLDPEPDLSGDPVWSISAPDLTAEDLASPEAYLDYHKRTRPDLARLWCDAIEADLLDKIAIRESGRVESLHDDELMDRIAVEIWPNRDPQYEKVKAPMLAIVPDGDYHHGLPPDTTGELRRTADRYWQDRVRPWIRQRTATFRISAPSARIVELDAPNHLIFIAKEDDTVVAIREFRGVIEV
jgi:pimeloyl-ACP methyl ester carboxylesterase